jgi:hypothetical protein
VFGKSGQHEELMLRSPTFQLRGVEMVPVEKEFQGWFTAQGYMAVDLPGICNITTFTRTSRASDGSSG